MAEKLNPALDARNKPKISCQDPTFPENLSEVEAEFGGAIGETYEDILDVLQKLGSSCNGHSFSKELLGNVTAWGALFKSTVADFRVDELCNKLLKLICLTVCSSFLSFLSGLRNIFLLVREYDFDGVFLLRKSC